MRRTQMTSKGWGLACLVLLAACLPDPPPTAPEPTLSAVSITRGDGQQAPEGETLPEAIVAQVLLDSGAPALRHPIVARVVSGNGSISLGGTVASGNGGSLIREGSISVEWTMGPSNEVQQLMLFSYEGADTVRATVSAVSLPAGG